MFGNLSDTVLWDGSGALAVRPIAITEYVKVALFCSLGAAHDSAVGVFCIDPGGILISLPSGVHHEVNDISYRS